MTGVRGGVASVENLKEAVEAFESAVELSKEEAE